MLGTKPFGGRTISAQCNQFSFLCPFPRLTDRGAAEPAEHSPRGRRHDVRMRLCQALGVSNERGPRFGREAALGELRRDRALRRVRQLDGALAGAAAALQELYDDLFACFGVWECVWREFGGGDCRCDAVRRAPLAGVVVVDGVRRTHV